MKPVQVIGELVVCFESLPADCDMENHFINDCKWSEEEFSEISEFAWFTAKVSVWKDGQELACEYLGACCYENEEDFYTKFKDDYYSDMVKTCLDEIKAN